MQANSSNMVQLEHTAAECDYFFGTLQMQTQWIISWDQHLCSLNCGKRIKVLMVAIFVSYERFSYLSKSYELCVVQDNILVL